MYCGRYSQLAALGLQDSLLFWHRWNYYLGFTQPAWSPELNRLYFAYYDSLQVWDCNGDSVVDGLSLPTHASGTWAVPGRNHVYIAEDNGDTVLVYDTYRDTLVGRILVRATQFVADPRSGLVYGFRAGWVGPVSVIDPRCDSVVAVLDVYAARDVAVNTRDNEVYVRRGSYPDSLQVFDGTTHAPTSAVELPGFAQGICYIADWNQLLVFADTIAWVFDCPVRQVNRTFTLPQGTWIQYLWNPRNNKLYVGGGYFQGLVAIRLPSDSVTAVLPVRSAYALGWNPLTNETYVSDYRRFYVVRDEMTGVDGTGVPATGPALRVAQNPASGSVRFECAAPGPARLAVFDRAGRLLWSKTLAARSTAATWNRADAQGRTVPRGVYFARLDTGPAIATVKVVLTD
jgi:hypothetical protein